MSRAALAFLMGLLILFVAAFRPAMESEAGQAAQGGLTARPAGTAHNGRAFRFNKVREGVYHALGTGNLTVVGNSAVIVNDNDVIVVDDHVSPAAAWVLLEELKEITDKPVRYVVNTHFHYDHAHGNQIFGKDVTIIGHEFTRQMLQGKSTEMPLFKNYFTGLPGAVETMKTRVSQEKDATRRATLQTQLLAMESNLASQLELKTTPPNLTLQTQMTLHSGSREIQIRFLGRAHTAGDVVVYLPREKVVITGDMLTTGLSNMSDAYVNEWATTLDELKKLDFDTVMPGHGDAFTDKSKIDYFQAYLRDVWSEVGRLKKIGVSAEDAARQADLTKHRPQFPTIQGLGVPLLAATRIYELLDAGGTR